MRTKVILFAISWLLLSCSDPNIDVDEFEQYRSAVTGRYTVDNLGIKVDTNFYQQRDYTFDIIEPSPRNYEFNFHPIHTPDSIYHLDNLSFVLERYPDAYHPAAYIILSPDQHFQNSKNLAGFITDYILAGPLQFHTGEFMVIRMTIGSTASGRGCISYLQFQSAYKRQ